MKNHYAYGLYYFWHRKKGILMKKGYDDHYESLFCVLIEKLAKRPNDTNVTKNCPEIEKKIP